MTQRSDTSGPSYCSTVISGTPTMSLHDFLYWVVIHNCAFRGTFLQEWTSKENLDLYVCMWMCACTYVNLLACLLMYGKHIHAWLDPWVLGLWTVVFMVVEQTLCPLSHQPSTCLWLLIIGLGNRITPLQFCFWCFSTLYMMLIVKHLTSLSGYLHVFLISFPFPPTSFFFQASHRRLIFPLSYLKTMPSPGISTYDW